MKAILLGIVLLSATFVLGQSADTVKNETKKINGDSIVAALQKRRDSIARELYLSDTAMRKQENRNNYNYILQLQKENRAKQKKAAMIRIAIGAGFLVLLIVGLIRKRNAKTK